MNNKQDNESMSYVYAFLFFLTMANGLTYINDFFAIGKSYSYRATCDLSIRRGFVIGKGWTCTKNHSYMCTCFNEWKRENKQPDNCQLARTFPMKFYHIHRWLQYLFNPVWQHPFVNLDKK